jgi:hypothetical protein
MAIGRIILPALAFVPLDGSSGNLPAELDFYQSVAANDPTPRYARWAFDASQDEGICVTFEMPSDYGSAPILYIQWYIAATSNDVRWRAKLLAITPNNSETIQDKTYASSATTLVTVPGTTLTTARTALDLTAVSDSAAAGDLVMLILYRDSSDDAAGDAYFVSGLLEYTRG